MSHYEILGVPAQSDYAIIRSKYRAAILALHPDKALSLRGEVGRVLNSTAPSSELGILFPTNSVELSHLRNSRAGDEAEEEELSEQASISPGVAESNADDGESSRFIRVQEAWEVLRDPESRAAYDRTLLAEQFASKLNGLGGDLATIIAGDIFLEDMSVTAEDGADEENAEFSYPCRCGDFFVVSRIELCRVADELVCEMDARREEQDQSSSYDRDSAETLGHSEAGVSNQSSSKSRENSGGLVLPCQSCSLHVRIRDVIEIKNLCLFS